MSDEKIIAGIDDSSVFAGFDVSFNKVRELISERAPFIGQMIADTRFHMHAGFNDKLYRVYVDVGGDFPGRGDSFFYVLYDMEVEKWFLTNQVPAPALPYLPSTAIDFAEWLQIDVAKVHTIGVDGFFKLLHAGSYVQYVSNSLNGKGGKGD